MCPQQLYSKSEAGAGRAARFLSSPTPKLRSATDFRPVPARSLDLTGPFRVVISSMTAATTEGRRLRVRLRRRTRKRQGGGRKLGPDGIPAPLRASGSREGVVSRVDPPRTDRPGKAMP